MKLVLLETPFAAKPGTWPPLRWFSRWMHRRYTKACARDCIQRGEAPFVMHLLYPQFLSDHKHQERFLGIQCGLSWGKMADSTVVYVDFGVSRGMNQGIGNARALGRPVEYRSLFKATLPFNPEECPQ